MSHSLSPCIGEWSGAAHTWIDPAADPEAAIWTARVDSVLDGRFTRVQYASTVVGKAHTGELTFGTDDVGHTMYWIDSFHTGRSPLWSVGLPGPIEVRGSYRAGDEVWGWRTAAHFDGTTLRLSMWNASPDGHEDRAIEVELVRNA